MILNGLSLGPRHEQFIYLLHVKFPYIVFNEFGEIRPLPGREYSKEIIVEVKKYSDELKAKTKEEHKQLYDQELEIVANKKRAAEEATEAKLFFNLPNAKADIKYWVIMEWLTLDEVVALTFGKDPRFVTLEKIKSVKNQNHPFVVKYAGFMEQAQRKFYQHGNYSTLSPTEKAVREGYALTHKHLVTKVNLSDFLCWAVTVIDDVDKELLQEKGEHIKMAMTTQGLQKLVVDLKKQIDALEEKNKLLSENIPQECEDIRSEKAYRTTIGAILDAILSEGPGGKKNSKFENKSSLVTYIVDNNVGVYGLGARTLNEKFAQSIKSLEEERRKANILQKTK